MSMLQRMQQRVLSWDYFTLGSDEEASHAAQLRQLPTTFANFQVRVYGEGLALEAGSTLAAPPWRHSLLFTFSVSRHTSSLCAPRLSSRSPLRA